MAQGTAKIGYWIFNYEPQWEAASKEVEALSTQLEDSFDPTVLNLNLRSLKTSWRGKVKHIPFPYALIGLPLLSTLASSFQISHIFASPSGSFLVSRLNKFNTLLTVTKDANSLATIEKNLDQLKKLKHIVVESEWHRELLRQLGFKPDTIHLIYPGTHIKPYQAASGPFKILFATSPFHKYDFLSRGIFLLIEVAQRLPDVQFILVWRKHGYDRLHKLLESAGVHNVKVLNGYIPDMDEVYQSAHATILPGLATNSLKPTPHSGLDSLAHGKPVLVSRPTSMARLVREKRCGLVFEPTVACLQQAILELIRNYDLFQQRCHPTIEENFSTTYFRERYNQIYRDML